MQLVFWLAEPTWGTKLILKVQSATITYSLIQHTLKLSNNLWLQSIPFMEKGVAGYLIAYPS